MAVTEVFMKHKIYLFIFALVLTLSFGSFERILACSCSSPDICTAYNFAKYIFTGKIVEYEKDEQNYVSGKVTLKVEEGFVGTKKGELLRTFSNSDAACSFPFQKDKTYLVYGYELPETNKFVAELGENAFFTTGCSRNQQVTEDSEDLAFLRNLPSENVGGKISGKIYNGNSKKSVKKFTVDILDTEKNKTFSLFSNNMGEFETIVPAGNYQVFPILPKRMKLRYDLRSPFRLRNGGCANLDFEVE